MAGKLKKEWQPHKSHKMTKFAAEIYSPCGTPRFYATRRCTKCGLTERKHPAGHFIERGLGKKCRGK